MSISDRVAVNDSIGIILSRAREAMREDLKDGPARDAAEKLFDSIRELLITAGSDEIHAVREDVRENIIRFVTQMSFRVTL